MRKMNMAGVYFAGFQTAAASPLKMSNQIPDLLSFPRALNNAFDESTEAESDDRPRRDILVARCGSVLFGIFADQAASIIHWKSPTPLPFAPKAIYGVISVRGRVWTVLNPLQVLGVAEDPKIENRYILGLLGNEQLSLAVDRVERIVEVLVEDIMVQTSESGPKLIYGCFQSEQCNIDILDVTQFSRELFGTTND